MKNTLKLITVGLFLASGVLTSCGTPEEKMEQAKKELNTTEKELEITNNKYLKDMENYKNETTIKIEANNKSLKDFNLRIKDEKQEAKAEYQKKIDELDKKNTDLKKRMEDFQSGEKEDWDNFKTKFGNDMDTLGSAIANFFTKNTEN